jgi:glycosyltransferase involved in cell wall biosynthesis
MLYESGMLAHFYTDICAVKGWPRLLNIIPKNLQSNGIKRLLGRIPHGVPRQHLTAFTRFGWEYAQRRTSAHTPSDKTQVHLWAGKKFCDLVLSQGFGSASGVYTFNSAGLELLQQAHLQGLKTIMEQTIAPKKIEYKLLQEERDKFQGWELPVSKDSFFDNFCAREQAEWEQSDVILCGSEFVREGIAKCGGPIERCVVVPYGVDVQHFLVEKKPQHNGPLHVLTVGGVGLRKGSPYVLEAAKNLKGKALFRMIGNVNVLPNIEVELRSNLDQLGPVPRSEIMSQYAWADVFLLPSLCEGSATVVYEALAACLPVICTPNTGSIVRDGVDGFIVPVRDTDAITEKLEALAHNADMLLTMSQNARNRAKEFTLDAYTQRLIAAIR